MIYVLLLYPVQISMESGKRGYGLWISLKAAGVLGIVGACGVGGMWVDVRALRRSALCQLARSDFSRSRWSKKRKNLSLESLRCLLLGRVLSCNGQELGDILK